MSPAVEKVRDARDYAKPIACRDTRVNIIQDVNDLARAALESRLIWPLRGSDHPWRGDVAYGIQRHGVLMKAAERFPMRHADHRGAW